MNTDQHQNMSRTYGMICLALRLVFRGSVTGSMPYQRILDEFKRGNKSPEATVFDLTNDLSDENSVAVAFAVLKFLTAFSFRDTAFKLKLVQTFLQYSKNSHIDPLTGVYNRRHFEVTCERAVSRAQRDQEGEHSPVVLLFDLDLFKKINDTYGHKAGDQVLEAVAERLRSLFRRPGDIVARLGGDEFAVLTTMPLENLKKKVEETFPFEVEIDSGSHGKITVTVNGSIGGTMVTEDSKTDEILSSADEELYKVKGNGRGGFSLNFNLPPKIPDTPLRVLAR